MAHGPLTEGSSLPYLAEFSRSGIVGFFATLKSIPWSFDTPLIHHAQTLAIVIADPIAS